MSSVAMKPSQLILCLLASLLVTLSSFAVAADDLDTNKARLENIQKQIEKTLEGLRSKKSESGALVEDMERLNLEVRRIARLKAKSDQDLSALTRQLSGKRREIQALEKRLTSTEAQIRKRLVVLYKTGEVGLVKALLSESESPREIAEKYAFLSRMVRHDRELLRDFRKQSTEHQKVLEDLESLHDKQAALVLQREQEQTALERAKKKKQVLLAEVTKDKEFLEKILAELREKATRLNDLVKKLESEQSQPYTDGQEALQALKGRLLWPVPGKLRVGFGTSRHGELGTLLESHGYEIAAEIGTPIKASAAGRVIFANSLRGYGKLMILDHGNKYYSLYAYIARFAKQIGDVVSADDVVGYSGFEGRDTVYFEIRLGGKPLDPGDWLKPR